MLLRYGQLVTETDQAVERMVIEKITKTFPDHKQVARLLSI